MPLHFLIHSFSLVGQRAFCRFKGGGGGGGDSGSSISNLRCLENDKYGTFSLIRMGAGASNKFRACAIRSHFVLRLIDKMGSYFCFGVYIF